MATIKNGYDGKPTHITVYCNEPGHKVAEFYIAQEGTVEWLLGATLTKVLKTPDLKKYKEFEVVQDEKGNRFVRGERVSKFEGRETLAYITLQEAVELRNELNAVIKQLAGV